MAQSAFAATELAYPEWMAPVSLPSATTGHVDNDTIRVAQEFDPAPGVVPKSSPSAGGVAPIRYVYSTQPVWSASVGANALHRSRPADSWLFAPVGVPVEASSGGDFGFDRKIGFDLNLSKQVDDGLFVEGRYFNNDADSIANYPTVNSARLFGQNQFGIASIQAGYSTDLDSTELNVRNQTSDRGSVLAGFRWIELHDQLAYNFNSGALAYSFDENNHLYGGQIGYLYNLSPQHSRLKLNSSVKAGAFGNDADNQFTANAIFANSSAHDTELAFVGDINLTASYILTEHCALRGGYQMLWIQNVALASDNYASTTALGFAGNGIDTDGGLFYNGATAAFEFTW